MLQKIETKNQALISLCPDNFILLDDEIDQKIHLLLATSDVPLGAVEIAMLVETGVVDAKHRLSKLDGIEYDSYHETYQILQKHDSKRNPSPTHDNERQLQKSENAPAPAIVQENGLRISTSTSSRSETGTTPEMVRTRSSSDRICNSPRREPSQQPTRELGSSPQDRSKLQNLTSSHSTEETEKRLQQLEATIADGLKAFYEVGMALLHIRDSKLYKQHGYTQFEAYCQERWSIQRRHAYRLIDAAACVNNLMCPNGTQNDEHEMCPIGTQNDEHEMCPIGTQILPTNERQVRPLTKLPPEQQIEAWKRAVETAPHGRITAEHIKKTINKMLSPDKPTQTETRTYIPGELAITQKNELLIIVENRNETVIAQSWKDTPTQEILKCKIEPITKEKHIAVMANLPINQLILLQERYSSLKNAIDELLK